MHGKRPKAVKAFTPTEEARQQAAVMMASVMKFAEEHGIKVPPEYQAQPQ